MGGKLANCGEQLVITYNGNPLQCSCLENPKDRGAWRAAVYGVSQGRTRLKRLGSKGKWTKLFIAALFIIFYFPGKSAGVRCHCLLHYRVFIRVKFYAAIKRIRRLSIYTIVEGYLK